MSHVSPCPQVRATSAATVPEYPASPEAADDFSCNFWKKKKLQGMGVAEALR